MKYKYFPFSKMLILFLCILFFSKIKTKGVSKRRRSLCQWVVAARTEKDQWIRYNLDSVWDTSPVFCWWLVFPSWKAAEAFPSNRKNIIPIFILACLLRLCSVNKEDYGNWKLDGILLKNCASLSLWMQESDRLVIATCERKETSVFELIWFMRRQSSNLRQSMRWALIFPICTQQQNTWKNHKM